ncbi:ATP-grasp domain-containing protein [Bacillus sp. ISL-46]|uniref:ATP-grasp domain-containing protein n=1 Tax=Bacillus sp. ISL-46 TaxID=2819129 RepID=UPI001BE7B04A|nr:ATP-grasp domain-containing protein [Bacillus sp. ISL-46]MBT2720741.1 ATP-grasp domain-containing protein [Bacillus sp. ISL-46]
MKTIVFIETYKSGSSREAIKAAERLGYLTVLFTTNKKYLAQRTEFPDAHNVYLIDRIDVRLVRKKIHFLTKQGKQIMAVLSFIDPFVQIAAQLSQEFGNNHLDKHAISKMEDKIITRKTLEGQSISPFYIVFDPKKDKFKNLITKHVKEFPIIVKSPVSTGSKDVLYVENQQQLKSAIQTLIKKYPNELVLIEEYLHGPQYLLEVLVQNGEIHLVAVIQQEINKQDRFIVTGYGLLAEIDEETKHSLVQVVNTVVKVFNINNGTFHLELRNVNGKWKLIEINPRISGGVMNRLIEVGFGINLVQETIKLYTGHKALLDKPYQKYAYAHYITVNSTGKLKKVTGKQRALRHEGVDEVYIKPRKGKFLTPPLSMGHRYGYVLASADTLSEAADIAKNAAKEIQFHLSDLN